MNIFLMRFIVYGFFFFLPFSTFSAAHPLPLKDAKRLKEKQERLNLFSPEQFSQAIWWAHSKGIKGQDQTAIVMELGVPSHSFLAKFTNVTLPKHLLPEATAIASTADAEHSEDVIDVVNKMAPHSKIAALKYLIDRTLLDSLLRTDPSFKKLIQNASVINLSITFDASTKAAALLSATHLSSTQKIIESTILNFTDLLSNFGEDKLIVRAAGNEGESFSSKHGYKEGGEASLLLETELLLQEESIKSRIIFAGAIDHRFMLSDFSNYPSYKEFSQHFLCALGNDVSLDDRRKPPISGTSFAAPTVAGAALLIKQAYPSLNMIQVKEVLLESAARNFLYQIDKHHVIAVAESSEQEELHQSLLRDYDIKRGIEIKPFSPSEYGKGVLDLRAAFVYADLKVKNPVWNKIQLRAAMKQILKEQDSQSATKIQAAFRGYRTRKRLKKIQQLQPQPKVHLAKPPAAAEPRSKPLVLPKPPSLQQKPGPAKEGPAIPHTLHQSTRMKNLIARFERN